MSGRGALVLVVVAGGALVGGCGPGVRVIRVIDGDTFVARVGRADVRVRVFGIDCPERGQPGFAEATAAARELLEGRRVRLERHGRDRWGRILARAALPDGRDFGQVMLERELAQRY